MALRNCIGAVFYLTLFLLYIIHEVKAWLLDKYPADAWIAEVIMFILGLAAFLSLLASFFYKERRP